MTVSCGRSQGRASASLSTYSTGGGTSQPARVSRPCRPGSRTGTPGLPLLERHFWADEYVRNESGTASTAGRLRQLIGDEIRALPAPAGHVLHAGYGGRRWRGTDVENLLLNNIDQSMAVFRGPAGAPDLPRP
jgi:hypothetical protein